MAVLHHHVRSLWLNKMAAKMIGAAILICVLQFKAALGVEGLIAKAGEPVKLLFSKPDYLNASSSSYRGCWFYKDNKLIGIINRGASTGICKKINYKICKNLKFKVDGSGHAIVEIPKATVMDGGNYTIFYRSSGIGGDFKEVKKLDIIEDASGQDRNLSTKSNSANGSTSTDASSQDQNLSTESAPTIAFSTSTQGSIGTDERKSSVSMAVGIGSPVFIVLALLIVRFLVYRSRPRTKSKLNATSLFQL